MPEVFKCPSCSAPLEFEGNTFQKCRFCGSNIIVPSNSFQKSDKNMLDDATFAIAFNDADELFVASRPFVVKYKLNF